KKITEQVELLIERVRNGGATQYFSFWFGEDEDSEEKWTIRVSNHGANPERADENTISFVVEVKKEEHPEDEGRYSSIQTNEKEFGTVKNQYILGDDNLHIEYPGESI